MGEVRAGARGSFPHCGMLEFGRQPGSRGRQENFKLEPAPSIASIFSGLRDGVHAAGRGVGMLRAILLLDSGWLKLSRNGASLVRKQCGSVAQSGL